MFRSAPPSIIRRLRLAAVLFVLCTLISSVLFSHSSVSAAAGINQQLNFQGRLYNAQGAVVPDGFYNIQFKIYQDGTGTAVGNPGGTLKWTEDWLNTSSNGVMVKNGFISVQLGSITSFSGIDWNQDTLWLSMNIGNTNTTCMPFSSCTPDGEMVPMKRLSSTPYALNAGMLGGKTAADFIQNSTTVQNANIAIQSTGAGNVGFVVQGAVGQTADLFQVKSAGGASTLLSIKADGSTTLQPATNSLGAFSVKNGSTGTSVLSVDTINDRVGVGTAAPTTKLEIATNDSLTNKLQLKLSQNGSGDSGLEIATPAQSYYVGVDASDGNSFKIASSTASGSSATAGTSSIGGSVDTGAYNSYTYAKIIPTINGTITTVQAYVGVTGTAPNNKAVMGLYATGGGGAPSTLMGTTSEKTLTPNSWNTFTFSSPVTVTSGVAYVLAYSANGASAGDNNLAYTSGSPLGTSGYASPRTYSTALPSTAPSWVQTTVNYSMYATVSSGSPSDQFSGTIMKLSDSGQATFKNSSNSTSAFQIQNATGTISLLTADTTNNRIQIGSSTTDSVAVTLVLDRYQNGVDGSDPAGGVNGAMYYNTFSNKMRCYQNNTWYDCINTGSTNTILNQNAAAQTAANFWIDGTGRAATLQGDTAVKTPLIDAASIGNLNIGTSTATSITMGRSTTTTSILSSSVYLGSAGVATILQSATNPTGNGSNLSIAASNSGGGNGNGGNLVLSGGTGSGIGSNGLVVLTTPTFQTATTQLCTSTPCTITQSNVDGNGVVIINTSGTGYVVTLPNPTLGAAAYGRIVYVTSASANDFTLSVNGGSGIGNLIAMRNNTTATMVWGPNGWTAAGASSSTTLQSAYDNTLQSAGGAELVVSKTSATNGFTIRDSSVNPVNGTLLSVQTASAAGLISVNGNVTEYASNAGAETIGSGGATTFPASTWSSVSGATVSRYPTAGNYIATGQGSVSVATTATAGSGVKNQLTTSLTAKMNYNVSFSTRLTAGSAAFTDLDVYYSVDGAALSVPCTSSKAVNTSVWTKVNCAFTAPASGITSNNAIMIRQAGGGTARTFYVDNLSVTIAADLNYVADGSVSDSINFATNWSAVSGATVSRTTSTGNDASDSAQVVTTAANQGIRNKLSVNPLPSTSYLVTAYVNITSGSFTSFTARYSPDGGTSFAPCVDYNTQTITANSTVYTKVTCYVTTAATATSTPYLYFTQTDATARTFFIDTVSMSLSTVTTPNVQIGGGINGGPTTLFTLDRGASAPIASDNESLLGSMYYDTTLGKLQCYEADGWGACGSSPDNIVTLSPEYTNAVLHGTGVGTMTSDLCSDFLKINNGYLGQPTICGTNETYNFYKWTSPQASPQTYGIYVTYQLPSTFKSFTSGQTSLMGRTDSTNSTVNYQIYRNTTSGLVPCGATVGVATGTQTSWQLGIANGSADPSTCGFVSGDSIVFKINVIASQNANAYVGNLNFTFNNR